VLGRTVGPDPAWVDLARHPGAEQAPGVTVVRVEAGLFFANADYVRARIRRIAESANARAVVLDAETTPSIDLTGAQMLADLADNLGGRGTRLLMARDVGQVRDVLQQAEVSEIVVGVHPTVDAAVQAARDHPGETWGTDPHPSPTGENAIPDAPPAAHIDGDDPAAGGRDAK
jgi:sulfate permease, SulP family